MLLSSVGSMHVTPEFIFSGKYNFIFYLSKQHFLYFVVVCITFPFLAFEHWTPSYSCATRTSIFFSVFLIYMYAMQQQFNLSI